jgi:hypothetical protein
MERLKIRQSDERSTAIRTALIFHRGIHRQSTMNVEITGGLVDGLVLHHPEAIFVIMLV